MGFDGVRGKDWQVVSAVVNVVSVVVRVKDGVNASDVFAESLRVEVGAGVDQDDMTAELEADRRPRATVF